MLSDRLQFIYDMVPVTEVIADIGTDHGYLPIALVKGGKAVKAYAMDVNQGPLDKANSNIKVHVAEDKVTTILSDGLNKLPGDVKVVVIAGMGGMLMKRLLEDEKEKVANLEAMVLSPHLDEEQVRRQLHLMGWRIDSEKMVADNDKYYTVMVCVKGQEHYSELGYIYGEQLIVHKDPVFLELLRKKRDTLVDIRVNLMGQTTENARKRVIAMTNEIAEIERVLDGDC